MVGRSSHMFLPLLLTFVALVFIGIGIVQMFVDSDYTLDIAYLYDGLLFLAGGFLILLAARAARRRNL